MKIHLVIANENSTAEQTFLVKAHTRASAEKFVGAKFKPSVSARVPTQQEFYDAIKAGVPIEDATADRQASIPEPSQAPAEPDPHALANLTAGQPDAPFGDEYLAGIAASTAQADAFDPYATAPAAVTP